MENSKNYRFTAQKDDKGMRLDVFLANKLPVFSRARVQKLIEEKNVSIGPKAGKANYRLEGGENILVTLPPLAASEIKAENLPLDIIYEDDDIIIVNKVRGMTVHPAPGTASKTLVNALLYHCRNLSGIGGVERPGIVHRLDKDTSGVMAVAKNDAAHAALSEQIANKTATRQYLAVVSGRINEDSGVIHGAIGRDPKDRQKMAVTYDGKPATTHFQVIERLSDFTIIKCRLETGRTHQIRVHLAHIGYPVVCDPKYGRKKFLSQFQNIIAGQALHSCEMSLFHPQTKKLMVFAAPLPADMEKLIDYLRNH